MLAAEKPAPPQEDWAMELLWRELEKVLPQDVLDGAGLKIHTTLDGNMQRAAVAAVDEQLAAVEARPGYPHQKKADTDFVDPESRGGTPYLQASAMAVDNHSGGIRVLVGGRDYVSFLGEAVCLCHSFCCRPRPTDPDQRQPPQSWRVAQSLRQLQPVQQR
jgi:penicillin-binding protein 1A